MEKLIIENRTQKPMYYIMDYIKNVIGQGKVSGDNDQYCYGTTYRNGICVYSVKNKKSDKLIVSYREDLDETLIQNKG